MFELGCTRRLELTGREKAMTTLTWTGYTYRRDTHRHERAKLLKYYAQISRPLRDNTLSADPGHLSTQLHTFPGDETHVRCFKMTCDATFKNYVGATVGNLPFNRQTSRYRVALDCNV